MPVSVNEKLRDAAVSHQIYLYRYATGAVNRIVALLDRADADIVRKLRGSGVKGAWSLERLEKLLTSVRELSAKGTAAMREAMRGELKTIAAYEADFQKRLMVSSMGFDPGIVTPAAGTLYAAAYSRPFQGRYLKEWYSSLDRAKQEALRNAIRMGVVEGETTDQIVRRVRGTKASGFRDGILATPRRQAAAVVRTAVNHTVTQARTALYKANPQLVKKWQFVATLDERTTYVCMELDGTTYMVGTGPEPPQHVNCRSSTTPVLVSFKELGLNADEFPAGTRASMNGQVPATQTYGSWLKSQPAAVQNRVLGPTRAKLFRKGGLDVSRFTDPTGRTYTLAELRRIDAEAFERAGLGGG